MSETRVVRRPTALSLRESMLLGTGGWTSIGVGGARLIYAGLAKAGSILAPSAASASAFRQKLKIVFRGGTGKNWRSPDLASHSGEDGRTTG